MKSFILICFLALVSFGAFAENIQIGFPVDAARMSLTGEVKANIDCSQKSIDIISSTNSIFTKHVKKNINVFCYKDTDRYNVTFRFIKGDSYRVDLKTSQPGRFQYAPNIKSPS